MQNKKTQPSLTKPLIHGAHIQNRTLVMMRWVALTGQFISILFCQFVLHIEMPLNFLCAVLCMSVAVNILMTAFQAQVTLSHRRATFYLAYDILQLTLMLFLTGGLHNPFSMLLIAPLTVGASLLPLRYTAILTSITLLSAAILYLWSFPLQWPGEANKFPFFFLVGQWFAIGISAVFIAGYVWRTAKEARQMSAALQTAQETLAQQRQFSALGAQAAAAVHELGSPLSTIAVIAKDLQLEGPDDEAFKDDLALLTSQLDRCRDILKALSNPETELDKHLLTPVTVKTMLELIAEPYLETSDVVLLIEDNQSEGSPIQIYKNNEISHGIGNLLHNALRFAGTNVTAVISSNKDILQIEIIDDGPGFQPNTLSKIGEPYISTGQGDDSHMGLGIFISKFLLENSGATLEFGNHSITKGAHVTIRWNRSDIDAALLQD